MSVDSMQGVTFGIKTLLRQECLRRLLRSIAKFFPDTPLVILDDSPTPLLTAVEQESLPARSKYIVTDYDIGSGAGRNRIIDAVETPYLLYLDDDFVFTDQTRIDYFKAILENTNIELVGGAFRENGIIKEYHGLLDIRDDTLMYIRDNKGTGFVEFDGKRLDYQLVDITHNFFLGHTDRLSQIRWDDELKVGEHVEFFLRAKDRMQIAYCGQVIINHEPGRGIGGNTQEANYSGLRNRRFRRIGLAKHGITKQEYIGDWTGWYEHLRLASDDVMRLIPPGETLILVDQGEFGRAFGEGRHLMPFLEKNGHYWGPPPDDETAIQEVERLRQAGAHFMVVGWPAFWWLEYYGIFNRYLRSKFPCTLENERLILFDLHPDVGGKDSDVNCYE